MSDIYRFIQLVYFLVGILSVIGCEQTDSLQVIDIEPDREKPYRNQIYGSEFSGYWDNRGIYRYW